MKRKYEVDEDTVECPLCNELFTPPIHQCHNGHSVCAPCCEKLQGNECPFCRVTPFAHSRNLTVEKILETLRTTCVNAPKGCTEMVKRSEKRKHEKEECEYRRLACLMSLCKHEGPKRGLPEHFKQLHYVETVQLQPGTRNLEFGMSLDRFRPSYTLVTADKELILIQAFCSEEVYPQIGRGDITQYLHSVDLVQFRQRVCVFCCSSFGSQSLRYNLKGTVEGEEGVSTISTLNNASTLTVTRDRSRGGNNNFLPRRDNNFLVVPIYRSAHIDLELTFL